jgi:hypothetical protein
MDTAMMSVLRQLPKNSRIISPGFTNHAVNRRAHENGLIGQRLNLHLRRQRAGHHRQQFANAIHHRERGRIAGFEHGEQHGAAGVLADDIGLRSIAVAHMADVADVDWRAVDYLNGKIVECLDGLGTGVEVHIVFELSDLRSSRGNNQVLVADRIGDVGGRKALGLKQRRVDIHHHLALLAAIWVRNGAPRNSH